MGEQSDFNGVSPYYDNLVTMVFGGSMRHAQTFYLSTIPSKSNILVLGGGTGWWLKNFLVTHPECKVVYVEASEKMIQLARRKSGESEQVEFRIGTESSIREVSYFDAVLTFCYLDLFAEQELHEVTAIITRSLKPDAKWLVVDFVATRYWHRWMLAAMYKFFSVVAGVSNQKLPDWGTVLEARNFREESGRFFYGNFIKSAVFEHEP